MCEGKRKSEKASKRQKIRVCARQSEQERERERENERGRETERDRDREKERQNGRERGGERKRGECQRAKEEAQDSLRDRENLMSSYS